MTNAALTTAFIVPIGAAATLNELPGDFLSSRSFAAEPKQETPDTKTGDSVKRETLAKRPQSATSGAPRPSASPASSSKAQTADTTPREGEKKIGRWFVEFGTAWGPDLRKGDTGFLGVRHESLPGQTFILRMPEYVNLYAAAPLTPVSWEKEGAMEWLMTWNGTVALKEEFQVARRARFVFHDDCIDVFAEIENPTSRDWGSDRYDMYDVMSRQAPDFLDERGQRTFVPRPNGLTSLSALLGADLTIGRAGSVNLAQNPRQPKEKEMCDRLMAKISRDGKWVLGIASDVGNGVSFNLDPGTACIHQNPYWGRLKAGEKRAVRCRVYLLCGDLETLWKRYQTDFASTSLLNNASRSRQTSTPKKEAPTRSFAVATNSRIPSAAGTNMLSHALRIPLALHSPVNAVVGRMGKETRLCVGGTGIQNGRRQAAVQAFDETGKLRWTDRFGSEHLDYLSGAYLQWIDLDDSSLLCHAYVPEDDARKGGARFVRGSDGAFRQHLENSTRFGNNNSLFFDLDRDGRPEFLYADQRSLTCFRLSSNKSQILWRWDQGVHFCWSLPAAVDLNRDGKAEIVFGSEYNNQHGDSSLIALDGKGQMLWRSDGHAEDLGSTPVFSADIDGDGDAEVLKVGLDLEHRQNLTWNHLYVFDRQGRLKSKIELGFTGLALGDLDGDGKLDGVGLSNTRDGGNNGNKEIRAIDLATGKTKWTVPVDRAYLDCNSPLMADLDGDGHLEVVVGSGNPSGYARLPNSDPWGDVYVVDRFGRIVEHQTLPGWPVNLAFCDIDDDGKAELIAVVDGKPGWLEIYRTKAAASRRDWPTPFGNAARSGTIGTKTK